MHRILVCPFGNVNLIVSLCEKLRAASQGHYVPTYICFTRYEREIYRAQSLPHVYIAPGEAGNWLPPERLQEAVAFTAALAERGEGSGVRVRGSGQLEAAANHYAKRIACELERDGYDDVLLFNGRHNLFVSVLDQVADLLGVPKLVFEQGLFRPDYLTIDGRGVNWRNSIHSLDAILSDEPFAYQQRRLYRDLTSLLPLAGDEPRDLKREVGYYALAKAYAAMKLEPKWRRFLRSAENRDLLEAAVFPQTKAVPQTNILDNILDSDTYDRVILCPLQVETDTQIILHSPQIASMQQLVERVGGAVAELNRRSHRRTCVLFKVHPMEPRQPAVLHSDCFLINESKVPDILRRRCDAVVTINSTVGIEAIEAHKPVVTLGNAFYSFPGVVASHCEDIAQLDAHLESALFSPAIDVDLQSRFIDALKHKYQVRLRTPREILVTPPPVVRPGVLATSHAGG